MYRYFLTYNFNRVEVEEPKDIGKVTSVLTRDINTHGCFFEFTQADLTCGFHCTGRDILLAAYEREGVDADVLFEVEYKKEEWDLWEVRYSGRANLARRTTTAEYFECPFFTDDLTTKLRNRNEVTVALDSAFSLDDIELDPFQYSIAFFHSKTIKVASTYKINDHYIRTKNSSIIARNDHFFVLPFQSVISELEGSKEADPRFANLEGLPQNSNIFFSGILSGTTRTINVAGQLAFSIRNTQNASQYMISVNLYRYKLDTKEIEQVAPLFGGLYTSTFKVFNAPFNSSVTFGSNEALILAMQFHAVEDDMNLFKSVEINFDASNSSLELSENTQTEGGSAVASARLFDAVNRNLEIITSQKGILRSDFLQTGAAANNIVTSGFKLRGFAERSIEMNFKESIENIQALFNVGYGIEGKLGEQKIVIAPMRYFYEGEEIIKMINVSDYKEETADDLLLNQLKVGFTKYASDENQTNTIDDVHTQHEYLLPIKSIKKKKDILCSWILSAYLIEITRRKSYEANPTESFRYDNDIFLVSAVPMTMPAITFGDTVVGTILSFTNETVTILGAETEEPFQHIENILDPATMYNLRYTPKRMLLNWGEYLNSFLYYNNLEDLVRNQQTLINKEAITRFKATEPYPLGDEQGFLRKESDHEQIQNIFSGKRVFRPEIVTWRKELCQEDLDLVIQAHQNRLGGEDEAKNRGYISVENWNGDLVPVFLLEMKWNYLERVVEFKGIKKGVDPVSVNMPGILWETLGYDFLETEDGKIITLE